MVKIKLCKKCKKEILNYLKSNKLKYVYGISASEILKEIKEDIEG